MKPQNIDETRELFRISTENERPARLLADALRDAINQVNRKHAAADGVALIETDAEIAAAIDVFINETRKLLYWELIGQYKTREPDAPARYRIEETGGVVTVWDNFTGFGFRFKKGDTLAQYTLTVITLYGNNATPEELADMTAATEDFLQWASHRFPGEFTHEIH